MIIETKGWNMNGSIVLNQIYDAFMTTIQKSYIGTVQFTETCNGYCVVYEHNKTLEDLIQAYNSIKICASFNLNLKDKLSHDSTFFVFHLSNEKEFDPERTPSNCNCIIDVATEGVITI